MRQVGRSTDIQGRISMAQISNNINKYTIVNIHAPPNYSFQPEFYECLDNLLSQTYRDNSVLLAGDFNCAQTKEMVGGEVRAQLKRTGGNDLHQLDILENIMGTHNITDAFSYKHPNIIETFTHSRSPRLDNMCTQITSYNTS